MLTLSDSTAKSPQSADIPPPSSPLGAPKQAKAEPSSALSHQSSPLRPPSSAPSVALLTAGRDKPYALGLADALISAGITFDFIGSTLVDAPELHGNPKVNFLLLRDQRENVGKRQKVLRVLRYYARLIGYAARSRAPVFHVLWNNQIEWFDRTLLMLYYRLLGKHVVFTAHNVNIRQRDGSDSWWNRFTLRVQYRLCHHILVHTQRMRDELIAQFGVPPDRATVIPFGINNTVPNTSLTPAEARQRLGLSADDRVLLFFGNIAPYKGLEYLVHALLQLGSTRASRVPPGAPPGASDPGTTSPPPGVPSQSTTRNPKLETPNSDPGSTRASRVPPGAPPGASDSGTTSLPPGVPSQSTTRNPKLETPNSDPGITGAPPVSAGAPPGVPPLSPSTSRFRLVIAGRPKGEAEYWRSLEQLISSSGLSSRTIQKIEYIPDEETEIYFKAADALVLPYSHVFQSGVLFLGYSFGLPVIATDVGSLREEIVEGETGFVCKPQDPADLARAIETYFNSPLYRDLDRRRDRIRAFANERYSWAKVAQITRAVYASLDR